MSEMAVNRPRIAAAAAVMLISCPVLADDTGLSALHALRRESGRMCFLDHFHYGSSAGMPSERAASISAIRSWADFVDLEYGSDWARHSRAHSKSIKCKRAASGWGCEVEARPCK
jgi:hypothetical protein